MRYCCIFPFGSELANSAINVECLAHGLEARCDPREVITELGQRSQSATRGPGLPVNSPRVRDSAGRLSGRRASFQRRTAASFALSCDVFGSASRATGDRSRRRRHSTLPSTSRASETRAPEVGHVSELIGLRALQGTGFVLKKINSPCFLNPLRCRPDFQLL